MRERRTVECIKGAPFEGSGSTPTRSLQNLRVGACDLKEIKTFIETHHYSGSVFGITGRYFFSVRDVGRNNLLCGGAIFGAPAGMGVARKYADHGELFELRRFVLADEVPRNAESRVLGYMLRTLKNLSVSYVLSYADPAHGHVGIIYKATGFTYKGTTAKRKHVLWKGKKYPDRNIHQTNFPFHLELRQALADGTACRINVPGKHIYLKQL